MTKEEAKQRTLVIHAELDGLYRIWDPLQFVLLVAILLNMYATNTDQVFAESLQLIVNALFVICFIGVIWFGVKIRKRRKEQDQILAEHGIW